MLTNCIQGWILGIIKVPDKIIRVKQNDTGTEDNMYNSLNYCVFSNCKHIVKEISISILF